MHFAVSGDSSFTKIVQKKGFCKAGLRQHGLYDGAQSWRARLPRAFTVSLLDRRPVSGTGEGVPSVQEVLREARFL